MTIPAVVLGAAKLALMVGSTVMSITGAHEQHKRELDMKKANDKSAHEAYILETHLINRRLLEEGEAVAQKKGDNSIKRMQASASSLAYAAAGGVEGVSVDQVLQDFKRSEGIVADRLDRNLEARQNQAVFDMMGSQARSQNRINAVPVPTLDNLYATAARGAGAIVGGVSDFKDLFDGDYNL